jgi:hypothetical protein
MVSVNTRYLPSFLVIGANKSGTTSLYSYLAQHPQIYMSPVKEPMFFTHMNNDRMRGDIRSASLKRPVAIVTLEEYEALFHGSADDQARGEASTAYLANPACAKRIHEFLPDVRLVAVLRNPIERAFSNYLMYYGQQIERRDFEQCVSEEIQRTGPRLGQGMWYARLGLYAGSVQTFQDTFSPEQLLTIDYRQFVEEPRLVLREIARHVGVTEDFEVDMSRRLNESVSHFGGETRPVLTDEAREMLREYYRADVEKLASLVSFDCRSWLG